MNLNNRLLLACWNFNGTKRSKWAGENDQQELIDDIRKADFIVAHNAKFELGWLRRCGLELRNVLVYDTMLAEWVLLGNLKQEGLSLQACCARYGLEGKLDLVKHQIGLGIDPSSIPKNWLKEYCHVDVDITEALFIQQLGILRDREQLHLVYQRGLVCACLADMEPAGLHLDAERVNEEYNKVLQEYIETKTKLEAYGDINWRSPKQVAEFVYDKLKFQPPTDFRGNPRTTATGNRPVDKATLSALRSHSKEQKDFVELFKKVANLNAKLSKSLDFFKGVVSQYDSTFLGILQHGRTATHRLASEGRPILLHGPPETAPKKKGVQLQNLAREFKRLFKAKRKGWLIFEADGCFTANARVLLANGQEKLVQNILVGDELIGFEEQPSGQGSDRKSRVAIVEAVRSRQAACIELDLGEKKIVVSEEHPFLARRKRNRVWNWMTAKQISESNHKDLQLRKFDIPSLPDNERAKGKLAAYIDGEGTWSWDKCQIAQMIGTDVFGDIADTLRELKIPFSISSYKMREDSNGPVGSFVITGTRNLLALQREISPAKSKRNTKLIWEGKVLLSNSVFEVKVAKSVGVQTVYSLQTSTGTYIAEELFNHNCGLEFRVAADLGEDKIAYDEISTGADIHSVTAETLTKAGEPTSRQAAKSRTFRPLITRGLIEKSILQTTLTQGNSLL